MSALAWLILAKIFDSLFQHDDPSAVSFVKEYRLGQPNTDHYNSAYTNLDKLTICWYFSFTTLSTTGFGDYRPISDAERFFSAFYMLFGVAVFSHATANYIVIIEEMNKIDEDIGQGDQLILFFATLKYYNKNKIFNLKMKDKIEEYFEYRWNNDRNAAMVSDRD